MLEPQSTCTWINWVNNITVRRTHMHALYISNHPVAGKGCRSGFNIICEWCYISFLSALAESLINKSRIYYSQSGNLHCILQKNNSIKSKGFCVYLRILEAYKGVSMTRMACNGNVVSDYAWDALCQTVWNPATSLKGCYVSLVTIWGLTTWGWVMYQALNWKTIYNFIIPRTQRQGNHGSKTLEIYFNFVCRSLQGN